MADHASEGQSLAAQTKDLHEFRNRPIGKDHEGVDGQRLTRNAWLMPASNRTGAMTSQIFERQVSWPVSAIALAGVAFLIGLAAESSSIGWLISVAVTGSIALLILALVAGVNAALKRETTMWQCLTLFTIGGALQVLSLWIPSIPGAGLLMLYGGSGVVTFLIQRTRRNAA